MCSCRRLVICLRPDYISINRAQRSRYKESTACWMVNLVPRASFQAAATVSGTLGTSGLASDTGAVVLGFAGLPVEVEVEGAGGELLSVLAFFLFLSRPNVPKVSETSTCGRKSSYQP